MEPKKARKYLKHLENYNFDNTAFTFDEFYLFQKFLLDNLDMINSKIEERGFTTRKTLRKLIEGYQQKLGLKANLKQIDIFIQVLDSNGKDIRTTVISSFLYHFASTGNNRIEPEEF